MRKESIKSIVWIKPFAWGVAAGALVMLFVIFSAGWVVTSSSAQIQAEQAAEKAVVDNLAPIAVAKFLRAPDKEERLKKLKNTDSWKRGDYLADGGWVTMPGSTEPTRAIAEEVARRLVEGSKKEQ